MAVVTAPTALTEAAAVGGPLGPTATEQNGDVTNGNKFVNGPGKYLAVRNTTGGAVGIDVYADLNGNEVKLIDGSVTANKVAATSVRIFGPFKPELFSDHSTTVATANGSVVFKQQSGIAGDLKYAPVQLDRG